MNFISFASPPFFKFCPPEYDVTKGCNTLRIGTLWGFRDEENEHLRDKGEGEFEFKIRFPALTPVSNEWISEFNYGDGGSVHIENMEVNTGTVSIESVTMKGSAQNCWVFCISMSDSAAGSVSKVHGSKWKIPSEKVQEFGNFLAALLWSNISFDDLPPDLIKKHTFQELHAGLALQMEMKRVIYTDREVCIDNEKDYPVGKIKELKANIAFTKPKGFCDEQEFRFAFWLMFKKQKISINDNPKILQLRQIDQFVSYI